MVVDPAGAGLTALGGVMTDRRRVRLVFVAVLACALPIPAASQEIPEGFARFQLFNLGGHPNPAINGHLKTGHLG